MAEAIEEFELKLLFPQNKLAALEEWMVSKGGARRQRLQAAYIDTDDFLLAQSGIALRVRKEGRHWFQTLKAPTSSHLERLEHNVALVHGGAGIPEWSIVHHANHLAGKALKKVLAGRSVSDLRVKYRTDIFRRCVQVRARGGILEYALDVGRILAIHQDGQESSIPVCELEIELLEGDKSAVLTHAKNFIKQYQACIDTRSKAQRGFNLASGIQTSPPLKTRALTLTKFNDSTISTEVLNSCLNQILVNASEINTGVPYFDEHLHQLRVGMRRLKTAMRFMALRSIFFSEVDLNTLEKIFSELGNYRDLNFLDEKLAPSLQAVQAPVMHLSTVADLPHPKTLLRQQKFQLFLISTLMLVVSLERLDSNIKLLKPLILQELDKIHKDTHKVAKKFMEIEDEERHKLRKKLKRLRYSLEFFKDLCDSSRYKSYLKKLEKVADFLGQYNDICVALDRVEVLIQKDANILFAQGWLKAEQTRVRLDSAESLKHFYLEKKVW
jgi:inorganic triphosphatase YgiF